MKDKLKNNKLALISLFLALEIMLFITLSSAGASWLLKILLLVIVGILAPTFWQEAQLDLGKGLYMLLMPIIIYGVVTALAPAYMQVDGGAFRNEVFMGYSVFTRIVNALSLVVIVIIGYFVGKSRVFAPKHVYITLLAGLAVPVLISLFATLVNYGFFHTIIYKGYVNYYNGQAYPVYNQASYLMGLKIMTVDIDVLTNGALLLLSSGLALLFFKKDQDKFEIISLALISAVGLLTLVFTGTFSALLFLLPAIIFALLHKFKVLQLLKNKIVGYVALGLVALGVLIFVASAFNIANITAFWQSNAILRKLFFNSYLQRFYVIFQTALSLQNLTGSYLNTVGGLKIFPTGSFIFDALWLDGLLGFVALAAFLVLFIRSFYLYFVRSSENDGLKVLLTSFLLTAFFRYVFIYPFHQYTYKEYASINHFPLLNAPVFLVTLFIAGFTFVDTFKEEVVVNEEEN